MMDACGVGSACGKVILLGEHAVVHGAPALAMGIDRRVSAVARWGREACGRLSVRDAQGPFDIPASSDLSRAYAILLEAIGVDRPVDASATIELPTRAGLGSSAALGVAVARAVLELDAGRAGANAGAPPPTLTARGVPPCSSTSADCRPLRFGEGYVAARVVDVSMAWERVFHGNPSGVDVAVASRGGCVAFRKGRPPENVQLASPLSLCIGDTGLRASTRTMVEGVGQRLAQDPKLAHRVISRVGELFRDAKAALENGELKRLGHALDENQALLAELGVSTPETETLCAAARTAGALGAKLTGGGGGGCVVALAPGFEAQVLEAWRRVGLSGFRVEAGGPSPDPRAGGGYSLG